jgi:hypothetical protein
VAVALVSAVLTVGALLAWHTFSKNRHATAPSAVVAVKDPHASSESTEAAPLVEQPQDIGPLTTLPEGIYTGFLQGVLVDRDVPLALISQPQEGRIVLALGLDGWVPTPALLSDEEGQQNTLTFRANGLILRFNRDMSSTGLIGSVTDVVSGEIGVWKVTKTS